MATNRTNAAARCTSCGRGYMTSDEGATGTRCAICNDNEGATTMPTTETTTSAPKSSRRHTAPIVPLGEVGLEGAALEQARENIAQAVADATAPKRRQSYKDKQAASVAKARAEEQARDAAAQAAQQPAAGADKPKRARKPKTAPGAAQTPAGEPAPATAATTPPGDAAHVTEMVASALAGMPDTTAADTRPPPAADKAPRAPRAARQAAPADAKHAGLRLGAAAARTPEQARAAFDAATDTCRKATAAGDRKAARQAWRQMAQNAIVLVIG
jgi:hypothetical protein